MHVRWVLLLIPAILMAGCVERRMTIVSDPPGASVAVNGQMIGAAPVDVPTSAFEYYGDYDILLLADGYDPLLVRQPTPRPWYGYPFVDFVAENVLPWHMKDKRVFAYQMQPSRIVAADELQKNATGLRERGQQIGSTAPPMVRQNAPARLEAPIVE